MRGVQMRPLNFGEILDVSIKIFTRNAVTLLKLVAVIIVPVQVLSSLVLASTMPDFNDPATSFFTPEAGFDDGLLFRQVAGTLVTIVIGFIGTSLATAATYKAVGDAYLGGRPNWRESLRFGVRRLHSVVWITLVIALLISLILLGVFAIALLGAVATGDVGGIVLGVLVFLAVIPLIFWLYFSWSVAVPALLTENQRGANALRRSFRLVRGRWWFVFGVQLVAGLVASVVAYMITFVPQALLIGGAGDSFFALLVLQTLATSLAAVLTTPFVSAVGVVLYFDLRVRKEGFDLQLLAQNMGGQTTEGIPESILAPPPAWATQPGPPPGYPPYPPQPPYPPYPPPYPQPPPHYPPYPPQGPPNPPYPPPPGPLPPPPGSPPDAGPEG